MGLHTANKVSMLFKPADPDSGINFIRTDLENRPVIKANIDYLLEQSYSLRRTSIGHNGAEIHTIEHLMAALSGLGIDNLNIELDNNEVAGLDGSSLNYIEAFLKAGIKEQDKPRHYYALKEPIYIEEEGSSIAAFPADDFKISYTLDYNHPYLKTQFLEMKLSSQLFEQELASSRTFCLDDEADLLKMQGLGKGANYQNTLVVGRNGVIKNELRHKDEFARHKVLDLIGDLFLLGQPLRAAIVAIKSGHSLNLKLLKKINQQKNKNLSAGMPARASLDNMEQLDTVAIKSILPHREPFLFVDKIISFEKDKRITGVKNVTINDYFFKGHFPEKPVMPGVLIVEAMAQVGGVMMLSQEGHKGKLAYFMAADNIKFRKPVVPGDQLILEVEAKKVKSRTGQVHGRALVDGKVVAEADLMFAIVDS
jgi:UDP-3-O-[3-hydroxymyristoyl] N-acetylglucosamine deacetylase/3-hydroxyacyl-[acyl-carrier-protein] dehydratase